MGAIAPFIPAILSVVGTLATSQGQPTPSATPGAAPPDIEALEEQEAAEGLISSKQAVDEQRSRQRAVRRQRSQQFGPQRFGQITSSVSSKTLLGE